MATRTNFLPNESFVALRLTLQEHLSQMARHITPANFPGICDQRIFNLLGESFQRCGADEGSIWILDAAKENLVISYNSGPNAEKITGFTQTLKEGIVSMVLTNEQSFAEKEVYKNARHSKKLDETLKVATYAMIVVPFYFLKECRGVISCVQLTDIEVKDNRMVPKGKTPAGFGLAELAVIQSAAQTIRDLIDYNLLRTAVGWT
jgi:hypothetical protein